MIVSCTPVPYSNLVRFEAWEQPVQGHTTTRTIPDEQGRWGKIGTGFLPSGLDSMEWSEAGRAGRQRQWVLSQQARAVALIMDHEPQLAHVGTPKCAEVWAKKGDLR